MSKLKVAEKMCSECLFTKNRIVSAERASDIIKETMRKDYHFECHKGTMVGQKVVCRGSYDSKNCGGNLVRIMGRLGGVEFVDPESISKVK